LPPSIRQLVGASPEPPLTWNSRVTEAPGPTLPEFDDRKVTALFACRAPALFTDVTCAPSGRVTVTVQPEAAVAVLFVTVI
jgi:hypothetical protein